MIKIAKEQFLLNWDEGHDNPDHDGIPTKMEKDLELTIYESLIDFFDHLKRNYVCSQSLGSNEEVDCYLKSINQSSGEALTLAPVTVKNGENKNLDLDEVNSLLKAEREKTKEEIRQWLISEDFEGLAERL